MTLAIIPSKSKTELYSVAENAKAFIQKNKEAFLRLSGSSFTMYYTSDVFTLDIDIIETGKTKISSLRKSIKTKMTEEEINKQLNSIRGEWQRDI